MDVLDSIGTFFSDVAHDVGAFFGFDAGPAAAEPPAPAPDDGGSFWTDPPGTWQTKGKSSSGGQINRLSGGFDSQAGATTWRIEEQGFAGFKPFAELRWTNDPTNSAEAYNNLDTGADTFDALPRLGLGAQYQNGDDRNGVSADLRRQFNVDGSQNLRSIGTFAFTPKDSAWLGKLDGALDFSFGGEAGEGGARPIDSLEANLGADFKLGPGITLRPELMGRWQTDANWSSTLRGGLRLRADVFDDAKFEIGAHGMGSWVGDGGTGARAEVSFEDPTLFGSTVSGLVGMGGYTGTDRDQVFGALHLDHDGKNLESYLRLDGALNNAAGGGRGAAAFAGEAGAGMVVAHSPFETTLGAFANFKTDFVGGQTRFGLGPRLGVNIDPKVELGVGFDVVNSTFNIGVRRDF